MLFAGIAAVREKILAEQFFFHFSLFFHRLFYIIKLKNLNAFGFAALGTHPNKFSVLQPGVVIVAIIPAANCSMTHPSHRSDNLDIKQ